MRSPASGTQYIRSLKGGYMIGGNPSDRARNATKSADVNGCPIG